MSEPLHYTPPAAPVDPSAQEEFDRLLAVLSEKGIITRLTEALEGAGDAGAVLLAHADNSHTRTTLEALVRLVQLIGDLDIALLKGVAAGMKTADAHKETPTWRDLAKRLADPRVRRGIGVVLHVVAGVGTSSS